MCPHDETTVDNTSEGLDLICLQCGSILDQITHQAMSEMIATNMQPHATNTVTTTDCPW